MANRGFEIKEILPFLGGRAQLTAQDVQDTVTLPQYVFMLKEPLEE